MADILVKISNIAGESERVGYADQIDCRSIRHTIDLPVVSRGATRTEGASRHGAIELTHAIDKASPSLRLAVMDGTNLGRVEITRMQTIGGASKPQETIKLQNTYVVRVETDTPVVDGTPDDEPIERFWLEYSEIGWEHLTYVNGAHAGTVAGGWSTATQEKI